TLHMCFQHRLTDSNVLMISRTVVGRKPLPAFPSGRATEERVFAYRAENHVLKGKQLVIARSSVDHIERLIVIEYLQATSVFGADEYLISVGGVECVDGHEALVLRFDRLPPR